jgi:outer membrane protein TolC
LKIRSLRTRSSPRTFQNGRSRRSGRAAAFAILAIACGPALASAQVSLTTVVELAEKNSATVRLAEADVQRAAAALSQTKDVFIPSIAFGSGLPAFPEIGFTGALPTIWTATLHSVVFSMPQIQYIKAAREGLQSAQISLKNAAGQVTLDASTDYIELDTVDQELAAARQQETYAARLVEIEQQRADAGVDPYSDLLQAKLTAAQIRLNRLHLETRAATLSKQLSVLTGLPVGSITPDHSSIPAIPILTGNPVPAVPEDVKAAQLLAQSKQRVAKGDREQVWLPQIYFGALYNRNTTLLNSVNQYYNHYLPANNFSSGFDIRLPLFDMDVRAKARESAAEALRATIEAQEAEQQNDVRIATLNSTLRELDAEADVASLKQQIAAEQLKTVLAQMELGSGAAGQPQVSPEAEQQARIDERQKYEDALETSLQLSKSRLDLLHALGFMQQWLNELHAK